MKPSLLSPSVRYIGCFQVICESFFKEIYSKLVYVELAQGHPRGKLVQFHQEEDFFKVTIQC